MTDAVRAASDTALTRRGWRLTPLSAFAGAVAILSDPDWKLAAAAVAVQGLRLTGFLLALDVSHRGWQDDFVGGVVFGASTLGLGAVAWIVSHRICATPRMPALWIPLFALLESLGAGFTVVMLDLNRDQHLIAAPALALTVMLDTATLGVCFGGPSRAEQLSGLRKGLAIVRATCIYFSAQVLQVVSVLAPLWVGLVLGARLGDQATTIVVAAVALAMSMVGALGWALLVATWLGLRASAARSAA